ncbi:hypothetical protein MXB_4709, partial [Myxobolus squamalis]
MMSLCAIDQDIKVRFTRAFFCKSLLTRIAWVLLISIFSVGAIVGSIISPYIDLKFGKRKNMITFFTLGLFGSLFYSIFFIYKSLVFVCIYRFLFGVSCGAISNDALLHFLKPLQHSQKKLAV